VSRIGGETIILSLAAGNNTLDRAHDPTPRISLLSASLASSALVEPGDPTETTEALAECRALTAGALAGFDGRKHDQPGDELVAEFGSLEKALACALQMQRIIDDYNDNMLLVADRLILGVGIHCNWDVPDEEWCQGTGLRVASTLCQLAPTGGIFISEDVHSCVRGKLGLHLQDVGSWAVEGEPEPTRAYQLTPTTTAFEMLGALTQSVSNVGHQIAALAVVAAILAIPIGILYFSGLGGIDLGKGIDIGMLWPTPPPESIAVLPFAGDERRRRGASYGDTIPARIIDALEQYEGIEVASRSASSSFRDPSQDIAQVGQSLDVEGLVTGYASASGDWLLVRAAVLRVSDGSELWSGSSYERIAEIDTIVEEMVQGMAEALELELQENPVVADRAPGRPPTTPGRAGFEKAKLELEDALKQAQQLEIDDSDRATALTNMASLYYDSGRDAEAIPLYRQVLEIRERTLGPEHPEISVSLNNLASVYATMGEYEEAESLYLRSLAIREQALGPDHPRVGNALHNLASLYHRQGRLREAEHLYDRALKIREHELAFEVDPKTAQLTDRATRYELSGQYNKAQKYYEEALGTEQGISGSDHPRTASVTRSLAVVRGLQGDSEEAESLFQRAVSLFSTSLGANHPEVGRTLGDLGELHRKNGHLVEAEQYHESSLEVYERSLGVDHPEVAGALSYLVTIFELQGRQQEATEAREREQTIRNSMLGPVFSYVAARSAEQGAVRERVHDQLTEPQPLHEYVVTVDRGEHVAEKRRLAESLHNLALLYVEQGRYAQAEIQNLRALQIRESLSGGSHPEVAMSLHSLARIYTLQQRFEDAAQRYEAALHIFETTLGDVHPHVARCWEDFAEMLRSSDQIPEAERAVQRAREIRTALALQETPQ
jgi:tetratricopeptide (TPR) repeat protein/class 3 adenylate cyclase